MILLVLLVHVYPTFLYPHFSRDDRSFSDFFLSESQVHLATTIIDSFYHTEMAKAFMSSEPGIHRLSN